MELTTKDDCSEKTKKITQRMTSNLISVLVALITTSGVGIGFYYNTNSQLQQHDIEIQKAKQNDKEIFTKLHENNIMQTVNANDLKHIKERCDRMEENQQIIINLLKQ